MYASTFVSSGGCVCISNNDYPSHSIRERCPWRQGCTILQKLTHAHSNREGNHFYIITPLVCRIIYQHTTVSILLAAMLYPAMHIMGSACECYPQVLQMPNWGAMLSEDHGASGSVEGEGSQCSQLCRICSHLFTQPIAYPCTHSPADVGNKAEVVCIDVDDAEDGSTNTQTQTSHVTKHGAMNPSEVTGLVNTGLSGASNWVRSHNHCICSHTFKLL